MSELKNQRETLQQRIIDKENATAIILGDRVEAARLIQAWWKAYQDWEARDTFNKAVADRPMTMRSFGSDFGKQLKKSIPMNIAEDDRFYSNSDRGKVNNPKSHQTAFQSAVTPTPPMFGWSKKNPEPPKLYQKPYRGLDTSAFADPTNFATREQKYKMGLHDLSVKLLIPGNITETHGVKEQSHHQEEPKPHFCFLPISKPADQYIIYKLIQYAKDLRNTVPELYTQVREIRANMTRVKLSHHYDMGTGYIAIPTPDRPGNLPYKVGFSVGNSAKLREDERNDARTAVPMTLQILQARQKAYFEQNANVLRLGNEFVIAMRRHNGPFPVYAYYDGGLLKCFDIVNGGREENGRTISALGHASW
jgi:hypothetical protein